MGRRIAAIIRHGDYHQLPGAPSAHQPFPLNDDGVGHARQAALSIEQVADANGWSLEAQIDCSNMLRAWQTARIIADDLNARVGRGMRLESFNALAERGVGCAANLTAEQIRQIIDADPRFPALPPDWKSNSEFRLPLQGAESLLEAGQRVAAHMLQRMSEFPRQREDCCKLFVGHGAAFRHAAFHLRVLEYADIARLSMFHGRPVFLELLDDGSWQHIEGEWKIRQSNSEYKD